MSGSTALIKIRRIPRKGNQAIIVEVSSTKLSIQVPYESGLYSTYLLEDYEQENPLIFKLQQRKVNKAKMIAEHVLTQLNPDWKNEQGDVNSILRKELTPYFKLLADCRLFEDLTIFRITAEKKFQVHVQSLKNLSTAGIFK